MTAPQLAPIVERCRAFLTDLDGANRTGTNVVIRWDPADPLAIHLDMTSDAAPQDPRHWCFARDLIDLEGDQERGNWGTDPDGSPLLGDVLVRPYRSIVVVRMQSPEGQCLLSMPRKAVAAVLFQSYGAIPPGTEDAYLDADAAARQMLDVCPDPIGHSGLEQGAAQERRLPSPARTGFCQWCGLRLADHPWWRP